MRNSPKTVSQNRRMISAANRTALFLTAVLVSFSACSGTDDTDERLPAPDYANAAFNTLQYKPAVLADGNTVFRHDTAYGVTRLDVDDGSVRAETVLPDETVLFSAVWGEKLLYCADAADENAMYAWYVYDPETGETETFTVPDAQTSDETSESAFSSGAVSGAADALRDVSGICVMGDGLYVMHNYWQGVSRIDLVTGDCVTFDTETWANVVSCSADETSFYLPTATGAAVFDLATGEKVVYDWQESDAWLGGAGSSATVRSAHLTENDRMILFVTREDAMVPDEEKRAVLYLNTTDFSLPPVRVTMLDSIPANTVTAVCGEYRGTLVLSDGETLYAYDTETDAAEVLCAMPENGVFCAGKYIFAATEDGDTVLAEIPREIIPEMIAGE